MLFNIFSSISKKESIKQIAKNNTLSLFVIFLWFICLYYEAHGGRANSLSKNTEELKYSIEKLLNWRYSLNHLVAAACIISIIGGICLYIFKKKKCQEDYSYIRIIVVFLICCLLSGFYLALLGTRTGSFYLTGVSSIYGIAFYLLMISTISLAYILHNFKKLIVIVPLYAYILIIQISIGTHIFTETNMYNVMPNTVIAVDNYILNSVISALQEGKNEMILKVPYCNTSDNWPHPVYMGYTIADALRRHGIIESDISITIEPDETLNAEFNLPY